jgi:hypothetical protein
MKFGMHIGFILRIALFSMQKSNFPSEMPCVFNDLAAILIQNDCHFWSF